MTLQELHETFLKHLVYLKGCSPKTVRSYRQSFSSFQQSLLAQCPGVEPAYRLEAGVPNCTPSKAQLEVREPITKDELSNWVIWMRQKGMNPGGANVYIRGMNSYCSWLVEEGHLPVKLRLKLLHSPTKPLRGFSDAEIRLLLSFRPKGFFELRTWTLIVTLLDTGVRIDEAIGLLTTNVNLDSLVMTVNGKGNKSRVVPISIEMRKHLFRYKHGQKFFFETHSGLRLSYRNCYREIKKLCAKAGVTGPHVHPHSFRHAFAVTYIRRGGDIYRLSRILGHTSLSTTQLYLRSMGIEQISENHSSLSPLSRG